MIHGLLPDSMLSVGTDLFIYALKEMVIKYRGQNSSVLMCFIDASKAFDRVNHGKLFIKLSQRGVPKTIVRILAYWYSHHNMQVKWGQSVLAPFGVSNGVRQGGILSTVLFNLYIYIYIYICSDLSDCYPHLHHKRGQTLKIP